VRKLFKKGDLVLLAPALEIHARQLIAGGNAENGAVDQVELAQEADDENYDAQHHRVADEPDDLDAHTGLVEPHLHRNALLLWLERWGLLVEGLLDSLAAGTAGALGSGVARVRLDVALQRLDALVGTTEQHGGHQRKAGSPDADGREDGKNKRIHRPDP